MSQVSTGRHSSHLRVGSGASTQVLSAAVQVGLLDQPPKCPYKDAPSDEVPEYEGATYGEGCNSRQSLLVKNDDMWPTGLCKD